MRGEDMVEDNVGSGSVSEIGLKTEEVGSDCVGLGVEEGLSDEGLGMGEGACENGVSEEDGGDEE